MWTESTVRCVGLSERVNNASVMSGYAWHAAQAVFVPIPRNDNVVSHPQNEWNSGRDFPGPSI